MTMKQYDKFYINGEWVAPLEPGRTVDLINPATEQAFACLHLGGPQDVDRAVRAARAAFPAFSATSKQERIALIRRIIEVFASREGDLMAAASLEMGTPLSAVNHARAGLDAFKESINTLNDYKFEYMLGPNVIRREAIGVCGLITPWNWPIQTVCTKLAPAIAAGCTIVLKPSEFTPVTALLLAEILHEAGVPKGVFNLINGLGPEVGAAMSEHPDIDMMSFTGSTRAGIDVVRRAAPTVKRVSQELGGKSPNVILEDADLAKAVTGGTAHCFNNSGQSCNAPTRMLVPMARMAEAAAIAKTVADKTKVGDPRGADTNLGPVVNRIQWDKIQGLIKKGIDEGAKVEAGGLGLPDGLNKGFYVRPTVFSHVTNDMTIAREEIFGPVLSIIGYKDEEEAVRIANDTPYGLAGYVSSGDTEHARRVARRIRAGNVNLNGVPNERAAPFGGYKQSGNGREWGRFGLEEYLEVKAVAGWGA
jgi:aldehyde dehydrogenase (NAD+)